MHLNHLILWSLLILSLGCAGITDRHDLAANIAKRAGFIHHIVPAGQFSITTYRKQTDNNKELLVVYIEGDGHAFQRKGLQSSDPTPESPVALELAARDPHSSVIYVARPCQYLAAEALKHCDPKYWSNYRYSEEVIAAMNEVINNTASGYKHIGLIGYSGGGAVATLIAARRKDVAWLVTVAANLDHKLWTGQHQVSPLSGSLNPADYAASLRELPQLHLAGNKDRIVPTEVIQSYLDRMSDTRSAELRIMEGFNHDCCWVEVWPGLLCGFDGYGQFCAEK